MASDEALLNGLSSAKRLITVDHRPYAPILVIVPPSVIANWSNEFNQWGHFSVEIFGRENDRLASISQVKKGIKDILLIGKSLFTQSECFQLMIEVKWELVIIDEFHEYKNNKTKAYQCLEELRDRCRCPLVGLTGTVMSNDYKVRD
jgi:SNF2 family DNA or RNA helicase